MSVCEVLKGFSALDEDRCDDLPGHAPRWSAMAQAAGGRSWSPSFYATVPG